MTLDRLITTQMSANIVKGLLKRGWSKNRIAQTIDAPVHFVEGVQSKQQVLTERDLKRLAKQTKESPHLMLLNSIDVKPGLEPLFESTRRVLELTSAPLRTNAAANGRKRRGRDKAA